jgi:hypothetical protein
MRLLSSFFLNGGWLVRAGGLRIGLYSMLGRAGFVLVVDARAVFQLIISYILFITTFI